MDQGEPVEATVSVQDNAVPFRNVIAELPGAGEGVIVGAHYDTVPDSIGASDNSSGMGALLAMAERLEGRSFPFRCGLWPSVPRNRGCTAASITWKAFRPRNWRILT